MGMARISTFLCCLAVCLLLSASALAAHAPRAMSDDELRQTRQHSSLGAPISLVVIGSALVLVAVPFLALSPYAGGPQGESQLIAGAVLASVGAATALTGAVWLNQRVLRRQALDQELERRQLSLRAWHLTPVPLRGGGALHLSGTF